MNQTGNDSPLAGRVTVSRRRVRPEFRHESPQAQCTPTLLVDHGYRGAYWVLTAKGPRRRYVSGKNKGETRAALTKAKADRDGGLVFEADALTVGQYLSRWLSDSVRDTVRPTTYARYEQNVRRHIIPSLGSLKLKNLAPAHVRSLYREKLDAGPSGRTVQ